eukprot:COSAG02_NODE_15740_length_1145_cov_0.651052_2_plen_191_part_00
MSTKSPKIDYQKFFRTECAGQRQKSQNSYKGICNLGGLRILRLPAACCLRCCCLSRLCCLLRSCHMTHTSMTATPSRQHCRKIDDFSVKCTRIARYNASHGAWSLINPARKSPRSAVTRGNRAALRIESYGSVQVVRSHRLFRGSEEREARCIPSEARSDGWRGRPSRHLGFCERSTKRWWMSGRAIGPR